MADGAEKFELSQLDQKQEQFAGTLEVPFVHDLADRKAGEFDVVTWNIYQVLIRLNHKKGYRGRDAWLKAHIDAKKIAADLKSIPAMNDYGEELQFHSLQHLQSLAKSSRFSRIRLSPNLDLEFLDKSGASAYKLNLISLRREKIIRSSAEDKRDLLKDIAASFKPLQKIPRAFVQLAKKFNIFSENKKEFTPLQTPKISDIRPQKTISALDGVRLSRTPPRIIEDQFRHLDVCSAYAIELMQQAFGRDALINAGLSRYGKIANAWDIRANGVDRDSIQIDASVTDALEQKKNYNEHSLKIKDKKAYVKGVGDFFRAADEKHPAFITAFQTNTKYAEQIWNANRGRRKEEQSYNSHVVVALGREEVQTAEVPRGYHYLSTFIEKQIQVAPRFQSYLNIKVERADGSVIAVTPENAPKLLKMKLAKGDKVSWQDVLISDFYKGSERVMGLGWFASQNQVILMDYMSLKNAEPRNHPDYHSTGFIQIEKVEKGKPVSQQMKEKLGLDDTGLNYYLVALADAGIDLNHIRERDLLPKFDMAVLRQTIDGKGGPNALRNAIIDVNAREYNEKNPQSVLIRIESGKSPWQHVESLFLPYFSVNTLTSTEKNIILDAVDQSCPNIDLTSSPVHFEANDAIYLTKQRIHEIANYVHQLQSEQFRPGDYVKIVEAGDSPYTFLEQCFDREAQMNNVPLRYKNLDSVEKNYLLKLLVACNKDVDLSFVDRAGEKDWKDFGIGKRIVLRKQELAKCIEDIQEKHVLQEPVKGFAGPMSSPFENIRMGQRLVEEFPSDVKQLINTLYPGGNLEESVIRSALYFVYAKEKLGGEWRGFKKDMKVMAGYEIRSIGLFQIRPLKSDMKNCKEIFELHGLAMPDNFEDFKTLLKNKALASTLVAGERLKESYNIFRHFMNATGEDKDMEYLDQQFGIMLATSYNRSPDSVCRAVFQNWAYNLAEVAGVPSDVVLTEIDATGRGARLLELKSHVLTTFKKVIEKLKSEGTLQFQGDVDVELSKIFRNSISFLNSPLFHELQAWYTRKNPRGLRFVFTDKELQRGDYIFNYGQRYMNWNMEEMDDVNRKNPFGGSMVKNSAMNNWTMTFRDSKKLKEMIGKMNHPYQVAPLERDMMPLPEPEQQKAAPPIAPVENPALNAVIECCEGDDNILSVYARQVSLRAGPRDRSLANLYFGTQLRVIDVITFSGEIWAKVRVSTGPNAGKEGFVAFEKQWFSNEKGPSLHPGVAKKLEVAAKDSKNPLPRDYESVMKKYVRFIDNFNHDEVPRTTELMNRSKLSAFEIQDKIAVEKIKNIANHLGYKNQKFFAILPKVGIAGLKGQRLFVIDTANDRVVSIVVSTGRPGGSETPSGAYTAFSKGYADLNYFGAHMGSYAHKYRGKLKSLVAGPKQGPISMTTALIEIRGGKDKRAGSGRYFHGTNRENKLGEKASSGCIRMSNLDAVYLAGLLNGAQMDFHLLDHVNSRWLNKNVVASK